MKKNITKIAALFSLFVASATLNAQTVAPGISVSPLGTNGESAITVTLTVADICSPAGKEIDPAWTSLGFHSGAITATGPWQNVIDFNNANTVRFEEVSSGVYSATFTPRDYYGVAAGTDVLGFSFVFNGSQNTPGDWDAEAKAFNDLNECTDFLYYFADEPLSVSTIAVENLKVMPNPVNDLATFTFDSNEDATVVLYDLVGKVVATATNTQASSFKSIELNTADLMAGTYVYTVSTGNQVSTGKLMKK